MVKKTITYTDYEGEERTEDFYFNLTKAEVVEMELSTTGGLQKLIAKITQEKDMKKLVELFKQIIAKSYGVKSDDGRRFIKTPEVLAEFVQTEAYSDLFMELASDTDAATAFLNGIVPQVPKGEAPAIVEQPK